MCMDTVTLDFLHLPKLSGLNSVPTPARVIESREQEEEELSTGSMSFNCKPIQRLEWNN